VCRALFELTIHLDDTGTFLFSTLSAVFSLLLSYGLLLLANGLFGTLLGVRSQVEGFSADLVGVIVACYFFGIVIRWGFCRKNSCPGRSYSIFCCICLVNVGFRATPPDLDFGG